MAIKDWGRPFKVDNPVGWITVGVAVLLTVPSVRRLIRQSTVNTAVGVMALGDRLKQWTVDSEPNSAPEDAKRIGDDTLHHTESTQWQPEAVHAKPTLRNAVVGGLATAMSATDGVIEGTKDFFGRRASLVGAQRAQSVEVGQMGQIDEDIGHRLPPHLMPRSKEATMQSKHGSVHLPPDFAVKNTQALLQFAGDVQQIGAEFKPEYERVVDLIQEDAKRSDHGYPEAFH